jgi:hypothetical protein
MKRASNNIFIQEDDYSASFPTCMDKNSTLMKISVHGAGEVEDGTPAIVEKVWEHLIFERFKPHIENGEHLKN